MRVAQLSWCLAAALLIAAPANAADPNSPTGSAGIIAIAKAGAKIQFFDSKTYALTGSIATEENPHELAISPDHKFAYVTIYGPGTYGRNPTPNHQILIVDLTTKKIADTIDVAPHVAPHGIQIDANGRLYVTCDIERKLLIIDPKTKKITSEIDTEGTGHWLALLPDASKAYISSKQDKDYIAVIDLKSKKVTARIPAPNGTEGIAASPDGKRIAVAEHFATSLMLIDTATDKVIGTTPLKDYPESLPELNHQIRVRYSPDGKYLLASYYVSGLVTVLDPNDLSKQKLIPVPKGPMGFAFAPDGKTALVSSQEWGTISKIDLEGEAHYAGDFSSSGGVETLAYY